MQSAPDFNPLFQYRLIWLIYGLVLIGLVAVWYGLVYLVTRKKKMKTVATLKPSAYKGVDLLALRAEYLQLIEIEQQRFQRRDISLRDLHQRLSLLVRSFVYEAKGFPAPRLTLADLKKSDQKLLSDLIDFYYPEEFERIEQGDPKLSVEMAKEMVVQWA